MTAIIITGGGTAGHTNPGIAVAQALVELGVDRRDVQFVGGSRGNEGELVPASGFVIDLLPGRGIRRSLSPGGWRDNMGALVGLARALRQAHRIVRQRRPDVVLCLGGYASFATSAAAVTLRIPLVVSEQNARASAVNRLMSRWAAISTLPYPDTDLPGGVLTGNPIRAEILEALRSTDRASARAALGLPAERTVLAVWSGSLGARRVNDVVRGLAERWRDRDDLAIHHVVGRRDWSDFADLADALTDDRLHYQAVAYEDRMPLLLRAADLAITRAGASTTAELAVAGLPAMLVPLPGAPRDHQNANAAELVAAGGGLRLADADLGVETVAELLGPLIDDPGRLAVMADAARSVARPDAARTVARLILDLAARRGAPPGP